MSRWCSQPRRFDYWLQMVSSSRVETKPYKLQWASNRILMADFSLNWLFLKALFFHAAIELDMIVVSLVA